MSERNQLVVTREHKQDVSKTLAADKEKRDAQASVALEHRLDVGSLLDPTDARMKMNVPLFLDCCVTIIVFIYGSRKPPSPIRSGEKKIAEAEKVKKVLSYIDGQVVSPREV